PWPGLDCEPLMDDALYPVMSPELWERAGRPKTTEALRGLRLLHDRDTNASWQVWASAYPVRGLDVRAGPRYASSDLVLRAASQGLGVALARDKLAADDVANGIFVRPFGELAVALPAAYWIVRGEGRHERMTTRLMIDWLGREASASMVSGT